MRRGTPPGKILIPSVVSHSTSLEHAELVADRIITFAEIVGRENVTAGTDFGLDGRVHPQIVWANCAACAICSDREQQAVELNSKVPVRNERNKSKKVSKQK